MNGNGISVSYSSNGAVTITNTNIVTNNNQITNGAGYVTSSGNTVIGTSDDIVTPSTTVINRINLTDGVIDSFTTRTLTLADLGYTGDTDANKITNNTQITNGRGFVTSSGNTIIGTDLDISNTGAQVIESLNMTDGVITSHTVRNLSLGNLGYTGDTDANKITDNSQIGNGRGYITSYVNTQLTKEQVEDFVGGMVTGNTETNISVTYNDTTGKLNFVSVNTQLSNAQVTAITNPLYLGKTAKAVDSDKLDGQDSTYYLNYNNFSNTPNLGVYAKLSGGNEFSGTQIFSGNVGIGTSSPIYKQHISTSEFIGQFIQSSYVNSLKYYSSTLIGRNAVNNESSEFGYLYDSVNPNNSYSYINTFGQIQGSQFVLTAIGNVGIGTNSPQAKLDVNGNAIFSGNVDIEGLLYVNRTINEVARFRNSLNNSSPFFSIYQGNSRKGFFQYNNSADSIRIESDTNNIDFFASGTRQLLLANGNATFSGNISANNLSGTNTGDQDLSSFLTASDISGKANKDGGNTFNGNQIFQNDVEVGGSIKIKQYSLIDYGNYGGGLGTSLAYQSQNGQHNFIDDNGEVANVRAKYKSADGSEGLSGTFGAFVYKNGLLVSASV